MRDQTGVFSKVAKTVEERKTIVTNNKEEDVVITLFEQLPKSADSSLKVKLLDPVIPEDVTDEDLEAPLMLTPANNVRWKLVVKKGERLEVPFSYSIEHPADREVMESNYA